MFPIELNTIALPVDSSIKRQLRRPIPDERKTQYENGQFGEYDFYTLLYDIFLQADNKTITAIGPPPLNLEQQLLPAYIGINGYRLPLAVRTRHKKLIILEAVCPAPLSSDVSAVIFLANGQQQTINLVTASSSGGLSLVTVQKNNKTRWIKDWISYYRNEFDIQDVYIYDNNSKDQETLTEALNGLASIIPWNFPHGTRHRSGNKFCQVGALNHFKYRFGHNRVIFNFDIDELLVCRNTRSKNALSTERMMRFNCYTVPHTKTASPDYSYRDFSLREKYPRNRGYKYVMKGNLDGIMNVHHFNPANRFWHKLLPKTWRRATPASVTDAYFLEYRGITTNWKTHIRDRFEVTDTPSDQYVEDTAVIDAFSRISQ